VTIGGVGVEGHGMLTGLGRLIQPFWFVGCIVPGPIGFSRPAYANA